MYPSRTCWLLVATFLLACADAHGQAYPSEQWTKVSAADIGMNPDMVDKAITYAQSSPRDSGSGYITRHGQLVASWGDPQKTYDLKSSSKSIGATVLALAIADAKLTLDDQANTHLPSLGAQPETNLQTGWLDQITIRHLATQTAGFAKPGGYHPLLFEPGAAWHYSDGGPNHLADIITTLYQQDIETLLFERVFTPIGITDKDLRWRNNSYRPHELDGVKRREFGSGVHANVDAMARLGLLYLRRGQWNNQQLIPADYVDLATSTPPQLNNLPSHPQAEVDGRNWSNHYGSAAAHYGLLWWNNNDGALQNVPRDAYWSWGLYDSLIVVIPSLDIVATRAGKSWKREEGAAHYDVLKPFIENIAQSVIDTTHLNTSAPYPPSTFITGIQWAPVDSIIRLANGSDNWPITWADDNKLYTAYGDGYGFEPRLKTKLSLGLAAVAGHPPNIAAANLRSPTAEHLGAGPKGLKASGLLCVDATLYMWLRNAGNAQLASSTDHGQTWTYADWKFETSFGCPTFLNFGQNYAGAPDHYVYLYSQDSDSAYPDAAADGFVLARVHKNSILDRNAYEFFNQLDRNQQSTWSSDIQKRGLVFKHPGRAYRGGVTYNGPLDRYLWVQILPESTDPRGPRFQGGFGIYEAPNPWGPWATVFFTNTWDTGPGETASFPTKWMSQDGKTLHLLFSGDDHFSVRQATLEMR